MNNETKKMLDSFGVIPEEYYEILDIEDYKFDAIYDSLKEELIKSLTSSSFQKDIIEVVRNNPDFDIDAERKIFSEIIEGIAKDTELTNNKKDMMYTILNYTLDMYNRIAESLREEVSVRIVKLSPNAVLPEYAHPTDTGADIVAIGTTTIKPKETKIIKTGLAVAIPSGYEIQIRPRSGLSLKSPLRIANAPGTIDSEYRGEIGIIMTNISDEEYTIKKGTKIAQMVIAPTPKIVWEEVSSEEELGATDRGKGGFGSTGQ